MQEYNWLIQALITVLLTAVIHFTLIRERLIAMETKLTQLSKSVMELQENQRKAEHQLIRLLTKLKLEPNL